MRRIEIRALQKIDIDCPVARPVFLHLVSDADGRVWVGVSQEFLDGSDPWGLAPPIRFPLEALPDILGSLAELNDVDPERLREALEDASAHLEDVRALRSDRLGLAT